MQQNRRGIIRSGLALIGTMWRAQHRRVRTHRLDSSRIKRSSITTTDAARTAESISRDFSRISTTTSMPLARITSKFGL